MPEPTRTQVTIDDPIINSPFVRLRRGGVYTDERGGGQASPKRHFKFGDNGITSEIVEGQRESFLFNK